MKLAWRELLALRTTIIFELQNIKVDQLPNDVDFPIIPCPHPSGDYISAMLIESELNLYASPDYLEKYGEPKKLANLTKHAVSDQKKVIYHD